MTEAQTTPIFELGLFCLFVCFLSQLHKCKVLWPLLQWFWRHSAKCFLGKTCHSEAILASYFRLTRPGSYLNEWGENQNFPFNGHRTVACIDSWIKSDKKKKKGFWQLSWQDLLLLFHNTNCFWSSSHRSTWTNASLVSAVWITCPGDLGHLREIHLCRAY